MHTVEIATLCKYINVTVSHETAFFNTHMDFCFFCKLKILKNTKNFKKAAFTITS